jgi:hypothetical protein
MLWNQRKPTLYIVRSLSLADDVSAIALSNYFSFERLGQVTASDNPLAVLTAEAALPFSVTPHLDLDAKARPKQEFETQEEFDLRWKEFLDDKIKERADTNFPPVIVTHDDNIAATTKATNAVMPGGIIAVYTDSTKAVQLEPKLGAVLEDVDSASSE